ncbi:hypothetical protein QL093DRAFT_2369353 [Fusarium oxysporum]|nr:hypothetical protein QL093DRAFT_2369353 [Fusarium oxysporum]
MPLSMERFFKSIGGQRIVRFSNYYIIKYGLNVSLIDGENVRFVQETGTASVPEVFVL